MKKPQLSKKRAVRAAMGAVLGIALLAGGMVGAARADDDDDDELLDTKILRGLLEGLGLRKNETGITYRERSPLVVPPSRDLPAPSTKSAAERTATWPNDPDVKRRKEAKVKRTDPVRDGDTAVDRLRPLRPNELRASGAQASKSSADNSYKDYTSPMKPSELGYKGGVFSSIFGSKEDDYTTFTGEAPRTRLIEPPTGYRTPSPYQPYGVGKEKYTPPRIEDKAVPVR